MTRPRMHADEVDVDERLVSSLLRRQFPDLARLPLRPVASTGTVNALFRLGADLLVRLPITPRWHDLPKEACWLAALRPQLALPIPEVVAVGQPDDGYAWPWGVFRWIEGEPWREDRRRDVGAATSLAAFVLSLQDIDHEAVPCDPPGRVPSLGRLDDAMRDATRTAGDLVDGAAVLRAWDAALAVPKWQGRRPLLHSDLLGGNVLVRDGRVAAVIDWSSLAVGDPAHELAAAWSLFDGEARAAFRDALPFDEATWARARGWALRRIFGVVYYAETNPEFSADARRVIAAVVEDIER